MWGDNHWYCKHCNRLAYNSCPAINKDNQLYCAYCDKREILKDWETLEATFFEWRVENEN